MAALHPSTTRALLTIWVTELHHSMGHYLFAQPEGKDGHAQALVHTASGDLPAESSPVEMSRRPLVGTDLSPSEQARLPARGHDRYHSVDLGGTMSP